MNYVQIMKRRKVFGKHVVVKALLATTGNITLFIDASEVIFKYRVLFFSYLTDKHRPDAPPALHHTPPVGEV
jgi:hypothetical protein